LRNIDFIKSQGAGGELIDRYELAALDVPLNGCSRDADTLGGFGECYQGHVVFAVVCIPWMLLVHV